MGEGDVGQVSPDGKWYWDGKSWISAVSPDGNSRWNGNAWVAVKTAKTPPSTNLWLIGGGVGAVAIALIVAAFGVAAMVSPSSSRTALVQPPRASQHSTSPLPVLGLSPSPKPSVAVSPTPSPSPSPSPKPTQKPTQKPRPPSDPYAALRAQGVSAICNDGTYSYSRHRSGTCSHHGGVRVWTGLI
jgi:hypothetical protein